MRFLAIRPVLAIALVALAACDDALSPIKPDGVGLQADLSVAANAVGSPATRSFGALGSQMGMVLDPSGGALGIASVTMALMKDPGAALAQPDVRATLSGDAPAASTASSLLPPAALGKTFVYDTLLGRYAVSARQGAPANGVRFMLYDVDPETDWLALPLLEIGYADFSRPAADTTSARVEVYDGVNAPVKLVDYTAALRGPLLLPSLVVSGWMRNAADSLTFSLNAGFDLQSEGITLVWRTALPKRAIRSRMHTVFVLSGMSGSAQVLIEGSLLSPSGRLGLAGTLVEGTGGTLMATINGGPFAKLTLDGDAPLDDSTPAFTRPDGSALPAEAQQLVARMLEWFAGGFALFTGLLDPVQSLLSPLGGVFGPA